MAKAKQAIIDEVYGAEDWVPTHQETVARLEQLLTILTDPKVPDGSVIQLNTSGTYSLSEGAIRDRASLEHRSTQPIEGCNAVSLSRKAKS